MKKLFKGFKNLITSLFGIVVVLLSSICGSATFALAEGSELMEELATLTIDGVTFNEADYPADKEGTVGLLSLYEYGFGGDTYALWLYVYTPKQTVSDDVRNAVQMFTGTGKGYDGDGHYAKFNLKLVSTTSDKRFAKFSVVFNEETMLNCLDATERKYDVSSIELYESGTNATSYVVDRAYTYTGVNDELTCSVSYYVAGETENVRLDVHHTTWRPNWSKQGAASKYVQDSIHSVYFAVPKENAEKYDYLNSAKCEWYNARTTPIFVTGNEEVHNALQECIESQSGEVIDGETVAPEKFDYCKKVIFNYALCGGVEDTGETHKPTTTWSFAGSTSSDFPVTLGKELPALYWNIYVDDANLGNNYVSSNEIENYINTIHPYYNDKAVLDRYPSYYFESWDNEKHTEIIEVGKEYELTSEKIENKRWLLLFGKTTVSEQETFKNIKAIQQVKSITGEKETDCKEYYISENDYEDFKAFYEENENDKIIYLLRFATSEYTSMQVRQYKFNSGFDAMFNLVKLLDTNAFFAQTDVFLDFDIIDLEYVKNGEHVVIPVNMSPVDIFPELTPPPYWEDPFAWWPYGLAIIAGLTAVGVVYGIVKKEKGE